jgi:hypothetical protein
MTGRLCTWCQSPARFEVEVLPAVIEDESEALPAVSKLACPAHALSPGQLELFDDQATRERR